MNRPILYMMCGLPGAGKSAFAQELHALYRDAIYLSSDEIRKELYGDESNQTNPQQVFALLHERAIEALNGGFDVIYDATNITRKDRAHLLSICPAFVKKIGYIVWAPIEVCIKRDAARERTVGQAVIDKMLKRFQCPYYDEGFDYLFVHTTVEDFNTDEYYYQCVKAMDIPHDNPHHAEDIKTHSKLAGRYALDHNFGDTIQFAATFHDVGKPYTKDFRNAKGEPTEVAHYYNHQNVGAWIAYGLFIGTRDCVNIVWLINNHMSPFLHENYYKHLPNYLKQQINMLHDCDVHAMKEVVE